MSFRDTGWLELRPLTLIYGRNSVGKSNIQKAFEFLRSDLTEYKKSISLENETSRFKLKSYSKCLPNLSDEKKIVRLSFRISLETNLLTSENSIISLEEDQPIDIHLSFRQSQEGDFGELDDFSVELSESVLGKQIILSGIKNPRITAEEKWEIGSQWYEFNNNPSSIWSNVNFDFDMLPQMVSSTDSDLDNMLRIEEAPDENGNRQTDENGEIVYVGDDQLPEVREAKKHARFFKSLLYLLKIDIFAYFDSYNHFGVYKSNDDSDETSIDEESLNWTIQIITGMKEKNNTSNSLMPTGLGAKQISQYIQKLFRLKKDSYCFVEQPEAYLHPASQANLADLFIDLAYKNSINLIIETHSELMLLRLMKRVKQLTKNITMPILLEHIRKRNETAPLSKLVSIIVVSKDDLFGYSKATQLHLDALGELQEILWPEGFFEEAFRERLSGK